jgi:hypothetical protein
MAAELTIRPTIGDWRVAREVYSLFARKEGSGHIATRFALAHLAAILREQPIRSVLEFGSGIGTITHLLLRLLPADARIVCIEPNAWCREQFAINIPPRERVTLVAEKRPAVSETFDLVIVDGRPTTGNYVHDGTICFVEGHRKHTKAGIEASIRAQGYDCRMKNHPGIGFKVRWRMSRFGISLPRKAKRVKGCWIGRVSPGVPLETRG